MLVCFCRGSDRDDAAGVAHRRVNFTAEDDENLVHYMATVFPDAESGGRMGNKYYQELERLVRPSFLSSPCSMFTPPTPPCFIVVCCRRVYTGRQSSPNTNGQPVIPGTRGVSDTKTIV